MGWKLDVTHPSYVMMSSDYSQQEPKITAVVSQEPKLISTFMEGRDIYATLASLGLGYKYEDCLEHVLDEHGNKTDQVNPEGKKRRGIGKILGLGRP